MEDIANCRTEYFGGELYLCKVCDDFHYSYHSCKNRFCTKCGHDQIQTWLDNHKALLLPVTCYMVTFTLHDNLRRLARSNQKLIYDLMFRTSAASLQKLAWDPKFIGGKIGMTGVLQTWTRDLGILHPHIHYIVPGGGLSEDAKQWLPAINFLVPKRALSKIFRAKFRDEFKKTAPQLFEAVPPETWSQRWVVHIEAVGTGEKALEYLAPYLFHGPISNKRLVKLENGLVSFLFKASKTKKIQTKTLPAEHFIAGFLQHVLPHRFVRVRSYGLLNPSNRDLLQHAQDLLGANKSQMPTSNFHLDSPTSLEAVPVEPDEPKAVGPKALCCPKCGNPMHWIKNIATNKISILHRARSP
jgi:hypothetical protein